MPILSLTPGLALRYETVPQRFALYETPIVSRLIAADKWFSPGVFESLTELVSLGDGLGTLLEIQEKVTSVAVGEESPESVVAQDIARMVLRDFVGPDKDAESGELPPGVIPVRDDRDGSWTIRFEVGRLREWSARLSSGILERCVDLVRLDERLRGLVDGSPSFVRSTLLYVCPCGWASRKVSDKCALCGSELDPNPRVLPEPERAVADLLDPAVWLELAVAGCFRARGFETIVGAMWKGLSGLDHELDVVAHLRGMFAAEVEATSTGVDMELVQRVLVRQRDFPIQHFAIVSVGPAESRAADFARFHGIQIFANIRENHEKFRTWVVNIQENHGSVTR